MTTFEASADLAPSMDDRLAGIRLVDVDSHIGEPGDIWTKRLPAKWADLVRLAQQRPR